MRTILDRSNFHGNNVNTKLHRATVVDLPEDCAPEGMANHIEIGVYDYNRNTTQVCSRDAGQGRGQDCPQHPRSDPPPALGRAYWVACAIAVASAAWLIGINVIAGLQ